MTDIAVRVENLSKQYRIGKREQYRTFRDTLTDALTAPFRRVGGLLRGNAYAAANLTETIWALKDVSFEVKKGEVIGIIGRNGAGKSTLLKVLSRITEPTEGRALVYGRVGALLEVGTGFHPELTGRENIYLNGAILGMSREEIRRKFDEIVAFAEVEQFIDTPVKHYSSGMGLRLGFAVAAHLEPEILIVDEVLAVGDAAFQKKCLGKMSEVPGEGRTVLFVSHNMAAVGHLCSRAMLLDSGSIVMTGPTDQTINRYLSIDNGNTGSHSLQDRRDRTGTGEVRLTAVALVDEQFTPLSGIQAGEPAIFVVSYESQSNEAVTDLSVALRVEDSFGQYLFTLASLFTGQQFDVLPPKGTFTCKVPAIPLVEGQYNVYLSIYRGNTRLDAVEKAMKFVVHSSDAYGTGRFPYSKKHGAFFIAHSWEFHDGVLERNP